MTDMPDFDSMSPEEMMKWMESLAKRQGATEGLTTSADMQVAEVAADDARLAGKADYVPFGWTEERWKEQLAKEEATKSAKPRSAPQPEPTAAEDDELAAALAGDVLAAPSLDDIFSGSNVLPEAEEEALPDFDALFAGSDAGGLPELDLSALDAVGAGDIEGSPMDWLAGLTGSEEAGGLELDMSALSSLADLGSTPSSAKATSDPMDWLAGLADSETGAADFLGADDSEGSLEWMESLAKQQGADHEELVTAAGLDIPVPDDVLDDGPGYEEFSFEQGSGMIADDEAEPVASFDIESLDLDNPEDWLDQLASAQAGTSSLGDIDFGETESEDLELPDYDILASDIRSKLEKGQASPEEIELFFRMSFDKADARTDVPDYIETEDDEEVMGAAVQAEIPDWLKEQMSSVADIEEEEETVAAPAVKKSDTSEMMIAQLGLDEEAEESVELPDWLSGGASEDTGDIALDIFADVPVTEKDTHEVLIPDTQDTWVQAFQQEASGELEQWYEGEISRIGSPVPPASAKPTPEPVAAQPAAVPAGGLQAADLPDETGVVQGEAMLVPGWLSGEEMPMEVDEPEVEIPDWLSASDAMLSVEAEAVEEMDWLSTDDAGILEADMPDWLKEQVDDSITSGEDLPSWLAGEDIDIESVEEIPDWLRETMDEQEEPIFPAEMAAADVAVIEPAPAPAPVQPVARAVVPAQQSPAPVPVSAAVDVAATLQSAQQKISAGNIDGGLLDYEAVIRANQALEQVEKALDRLAETQKRHPGVFRVLGDVQMRQGKLQLALDTYRKALNML